MGSDMTVALAPATLDGRTLFSHNNYRPAGEGQSLVCQSGRDHSLGEELELGSIRIPQVRHVGTVVAARSGSEWGYRVGVNDRGVAIGLGTIRTRLTPVAQGLTGPDLLRLGLERGGSARQSVETIADLITRWGQGQPTADGDGGQDATFLVADGREAFVLEACGAHWALQVINQVKAVTPAALLRQDWDRISRGLADLAIERGWWPADGRKLDFGGAIGYPGPDHVAALRRWGQATVFLEEYLGQLDAPAFRRLSRDLAEGPRSPSVTTGWRFLVELSADPVELPLAWCAFGPTATTVYFPLVPAGELPAALTDPEGKGCRLWRQMAGWQHLGPDGRRPAAVRATLAGVQERFDLNAREFVTEARGLFRRHELETLGHRTALFLAQNLEYLDKAEMGFHPDAIPLAPPHRPRTREEEECAVGAGDF